MEKETEVRTFKIEYECDTCKAGILKYNNSSITRWYTEHEHVCTNCKEILWFRYIYPRIIHKGVEREYNEY